MTCVLVLAFCISHCTAVAAFANSKWVQLNQYSTEQDPQLVEWRGEGTHQASKEASRRKQKAGLVSRAQTEQSVASEEEAAELGREISTEKRSGTEADNLLQAGKAQLGSPSDDEEKQWSRQLEERVLQESAHLQDTITQAVYKTDALRAAVKSHGLFTKAAFEMEITKATRRVEDDVAQALASPMTQLARGVQKVSELARTSVERQSLLEDDFKEAAKWARAAAEQQLRLEEELKEVRQAQADLRAERRLLPILPHEDVALLQSGSAAARAPLTEQVQLLAQASQAQAAQAIQAAQRAKAVQAVQVAQAAQASQLAQAEAQLRAAVQARSAWFQQPALALQPALPLAQMTFQLPAETPQMAILPQLPAGVMTLAR